MEDKVRYLRRYDISLNINESVMIQCGLDKRLEDYKHLVKMCCKDDKRSIAIFEQKIEEIEELIERFKDLI